jgi:uncharacterized membrane protein
MLRGVALPGILLGVGLGGLFDGIVLHQILQWHHVLSSQGSYPATTLEGLELNTLWDGLFHAATYAVLTSGLIVLANRARAATLPRSLRPLAGWILIGWGSFNLIEGIVDHHILEIHHVRSGPDELAWDLGFLALGLVLVLIGQLLVRSVRRRPNETERQARAGAA